MRRASEGGGVERTGAIDEVEGKKSVDKIQNAKVQEEGIGSDANLSIASIKDQTVASRCVICLENFGGDNGSLKCKTCNVQVHKVALDI
eukprot:137613-Hanusia_phi.AAC.7